MHQTMYAYMFTDKYEFNGIWVKCMGMGNEWVKDRRIDYDSKNDSKIECRFSSVHGLVGNSSVPRSAVWLQLPASSPAVRWFQRTSC